MKHGTEESETTNVLQSVFGFNGGTRRVKFSMKTQVHRSMQPKKRAKAEEKGGHKEAEI
jgi:hypothetical protein